MVSSRTPEGEPNSCPVCFSKIVIEPSRPSGDAPCPKCGTLLWFIKSGRGVYYHESDKIAPIREKVMEAIRRHLGGAPKHLADSTSFIADVVADSLDIVELVMEMEEKLGVTIPDAEAEQIKTVGEAIDYIARRRLPRSGTPPFAPGDRVMAWAMHAQAVGLGLELAVHWTEGARRTWYIEFYEGSFASRRLVVVTHPLRGHCPRAHHLRRGDRAPPAFNPRWKELLRSCGAGPAR